MAIQAWIVATRSAMQAGSIELAAPAPTLAPGALAEISLALLLATIRHPTLMSSNEGTS